MMDRTFRPHLVWLAFAAILTIHFPPDATAADPRPARTDTRDARPDKLEFVRFNEDGKGGGTLDTAIASYRNADGVVVHLVAAVHVGEPAYYKGLADTFDAYDALLYELVKPKDGVVPGAKAATRPTAPGAQIRGAAALGGLQSFLRNVLKLEFQLDAINYDRPNFVHADLDAETFNAMQDERGESLFGLMIRSVVHEMKRQAAGEGGPPITFLDILAAMNSPDSTRQYKLLLARQFRQMEEQLQGMEGEEGSVLLSERNKVALRVLKRTIAKGNKTIGVFYGAGHMRGIENELVGKMGFKPIAVEWRIAWDMRTDDAKQRRQ
jgi:hypothetical protein